MYTSTKFDSIYAEVAYLIGLDGTALVFGSVDEGGWYSLVNVGGRDEVATLEGGAALSAAYTRACSLDKYSYDMDLFVIISGDDQGFVRVEMHTDLETEASIRFEEMQAEYDDEYGDEDED